MYSVYSVYIQCDTHPIPKCYYTVYIERCQVDRTISTVWAQCCTVGASQETVESRWKMVAKTASEWLKIGQNRPQNGPDWGDF